MNVFVRRSLTALPLMAFGCSAQRLFLLTRRFERALVVFFAFVGPKEMLIAMSVSSKCNEQILGSICLLNFFACSLT